MGVIDCIFAFFAICALYKIAEGLELVAAAIKAEDED